MWVFLWLLSFLCGGLYLSEATSYRCYRGSVTNYETSDLQNPQVFIKSQCIDTALRTVIYVFGFKTKPEDDTTVAILNAYIDKGACNLILLDWSDKNYSSNLTVIDDAFWYSLAVSNAHTIGKEMGNSLVTLHNNGLNLMNTVLLGWSLGCPLLGEAGRIVVAQGIEIYQIKCLDPTNPSYGKPVAISKPLDKNCAKNVYVIHTDPGYMGLNESHGTSDVYLNYRNFIDGDHLQPGCPDRLTFRGCSHLRSVYTYVDAMRRPKTVLARGAPDYWTWAAASDISSNVIDIGDDENTATALGNYFMTTNPSEPFGESSAGLTA